MTENQGHNFNNPDDELFREDPDLRDMFTDDNDEDASDEEEEDLEEAFEGGDDLGGLELIGPKPAGGIAKVLKKKLGGLIR